MPSLYPAVKMKPVMIRGAGLIGALVADKLVQQKVPVVVVSRTPDRFVANPAFTILNRADKAAQIEVLKSAAAVINLEGKSIAAGIWTAKVKKEILSSRVDSVKFLSELVKAAKNPDLKILQASATGFYGDRGHEILTEASDPGRGFLADTCVEWESAAMRAFAKDKLAIFRIAPVLSNTAGVFTVWRRVFRAFMGGQFGSGEQYFSWIHEHDMMHLLLHYLGNFTPGIINATAPEPVTNATLTGNLATAFKRHAILHVPQFVLKHLPGDFGNEMLLASVRAVPKRALADGFQFYFEKFDAAAQDLA